MPQIIKHFFVQVDFFLVVSSQFAAVGLSAEWFCQHQGSAHYRRGSFDYPLPRILLRKPLRMTAKDKMTITRK